jgi:hypothetical protein
MTFNEFIKLLSPFIIGDVIIDEDNELEKSNKELDIWEEPNLSSSKLLGLDLSTSQSPNNSLNISNYIEENSFDNSSTTSINITDRSNDNKSDDNGILENRSNNDIDQSLFENITKINKSQDNISQDDNIFSSKIVNNELNNSSFKSIDIPMLESPPTSPNKSMDKSNSHSLIKDNIVDLSQSNNVYSNRNDHVGKKVDPWASSSNKKQIISNTNNSNSNVSNDNCIISDKILKKTSLDINTEVDDAENKNINILDSLKQSSSPKGLIKNEKKASIAEASNQAKEEVKLPTSEVLPTSIEEKQIELTNESKKIRQSNSKLSHTQKLISSISASNTNRYYYFYYYQKLYFKLFYFIIEERRLRKRICLLLPLYLHLLIVKVICLSLMSPCLPLHLLPLPPIKVILIPLNH